MKICGIKLTHDGAIALIDNGTLIFSYEMEKLDNGPRHASFCITLARVEQILAEHGYSLAAMDQLVIDGWDAWDAHDIASTNPEKDYVLSIPLDSNRAITISQLEDYGHLVGKTDNILTAGRFTVPEHNLSYKSFKHVASHVLGAYCTSPFAGKKQDAFVLVWDGGMPPQLFYYKYQENEVLNLGPLFLLTGYIYINFAHAFEPFSALKNDLSIAGKAMAYMAMGKVDPLILNAYRESFAALNELVKPLEINMDVIAMMTDAFIKQARDFCNARALPHPDMLTTFQAFIQELILENLGKKIREYPGLRNNLCFAGGSALNIKWNSSIRDSGMFRAVWVPPFPNDSGSAIGTACCEMVASTGIRHLDWGVYSGPVLRNEQVQHFDYSVCDCTLKELATLLHESNEPVVFLNGPAELGPRALGNRSMLAAAVAPAMKKLLNQIKGREEYRPVAPICLEEEAPDLFDPGSPDPYMLFEHWVRPVWKDKVPAICHLDGTARLQTVNEGENAVIYELLSHYKKISGIPLLCNTSANLNGKGFFADVRTVMEWGRVNYIWNEGKLYFKSGSVNPHEILEKSTVLE